MIYTQKTRSQKTGHFTTIIIVGAYQQPSCLEYTHKSWPFSELLTTHNGNNNNNDDNNSIGPKSWEIQDPSRNRPFPNRTPTPPVVSLSTVLPVGRSQV